MKHFYRLFGVILVVGLMSACGVKEDLGNSYVEGKDHQYMWDSVESYGQRIAEGENGHFFRQGSYIYYLAEGAEMLVPLCNKVDCMHNKEVDAKNYDACNAYIGDVGVFDGISYYDGNLYVLKTEYDDGAFQRLYRIKEDGSGKEKVYEWSNMIVEEWCLHRGDFFYTEHSFYEDEATKEVKENFCVKKISVDNSAETPKTVYEAPQDVSVYILSHLNAYGNYLYFYVVGSTGTLEQSTDAGAWLDYHYEKQMVVNLLTDDVAEIAVSDTETYIGIQTVTFWQDKLVYQTYNHMDELGLSAKTDIYISELDGSDAKVLLEDVLQGSRILTDEKYIYLTNTAFVIRGEEEKQIYQVYNTQMQLVDTIEMIYTTPSDRAIGDASGFYFFMEVNEDDVDLLFFDKSTIGSYQGKAFSYTKIADWKYANADIDES
ncbi:MAG: hypothetical protein J6I97_07135 [Agathobacter sp.]|nr:hypothetical protein [Agathobacter sp.]